MVIHVLKEKRLEQIQYVVRHSQSVTINEQKIDEFVNTMNFNFHPHHFLEDVYDQYTEKQRILVCFLIESINFCFYKDPHFLYKGEKNSSAMFQMFVDKTLEDKRLLDITYLKEMTYEDFIAIFGIEEGNLKKRFQNFMETVNSIFNHNFYEELFSLKNTEEFYNYIVTNFKSFNDLAVYKGKEIKFYKRATLLIHDLFLVSDTIQKNIKNVDDLLGCADYVIPKGMHAYGMLEYTEKLEDKINHYVEIEPFSEEEVEIRANMLWILELIKKKLKEKGIVINSVTLDNVLWENLRGTKGINHRCDTIYY